MRTKVFYILLLLSIQSFSQSSELSVLENKEEQLLKKITTLQDSLYLIRSQINGFKKAIENEEEPIYTTAKGGTLRDSPNAQGKIIMEIPASTPIKVYSFENYYNRVCVGDTCGFLIEAFVAKNRKTIALKESFLKLKKDEDEAKKQALASQVEKEMKAKYGNEALKKMKMKLYWLGMNKEQLIYSRGKPTDINSSEDSYGTREQWVYPYGLYIYFENGIVTSIQD